MSTDDRLPGPGVVGEGRGVGSRVGGRLVDERRVPVTVGRSDGPAEQLQEAT